MAKPAYWPEGPEDYWRDLGTDLSRELSRYDAVVWMQTSAALGIYDGDSSNACRFEDAVGAMAAGEVLARLWEKHPKLSRVSAFPSREEKIAAVKRVLDEILTQE